MWIISDTLELVLKHKKSCCLTCLYCSKENLRLVGLAEIKPPNELQSFKEVYLAPPKECVVSPGKQPIV